MLLEEIEIELAVLRNIIKGDTTSIYADFITPAVVDACLNRRDSRVSVTDTYNFGT